MNVAGCANCGAARRTDRLMFCSECGLPYPADSAVQSVTRRPPVLTHPWFLVIVLIALLGAGLSLLARDVTVILGPVITDDRNVGAGLWILLSAVYWAPTLIAVVRRRMPVWTVALVNLLLGLTVLGWLYALWMATGGRTYEHVPGGATDSARSP